MNRKKMFVLAVVIIISMTLGGLDMAIAQQGNQITRVSVGSSGIQGNDHSREPSISGDGRLVAFESIATNLIPTGTTDGRRHIYVHDRLTNTTELISYNFQTNQEANDNSFEPSISADGRFVAFKSDATNLTSGNTFGNSQIFVHDRLGNRETRLVSFAYGTQNGGNNDSSSPSISGDGGLIAFASKATDLVDGWILTAERSQIYVYNRQHPSVQIVTYGEFNVQGNDESIAPAISENGQYIAFQSMARNLIPGWEGFLTEGRWHIYRRETYGFNTRLVSHGYEANVEGNNLSSRPSISSDGMMVAFVSYAGNLVEDTWDFSAFRAHVFVYSIDDSRAYLVSRDYGGNLVGNDHSWTPSISGDGNLITFQSHASNLVENGNSTEDIYLYDHQAPNTKTILISAAVDGGAADGSKGRPVISANGSTIAFDSTSSDFIENDTNNIRHVFVFGPSVGTQIFLPLILR